MSTSHRADAADRRHGGPGSSHQAPDRPDPTAKVGPNPGAATSDSRSHVSGGGGGHDRHHTHDPDRKGYSPRFAVRRAASAPAAREAFPG